MKDDSASADASVERLIRALHRDHRRRRPAPPCGGRRRRTRRASRKWRAVQGVRSNQLVGYGLVVGLDGTGDQTT